MKLATQEEEYRKYQKQSEEVVEVEENENQTKSDQKPSICSFFLEKKCKFGPKGKNHNGTCSFLHPPTCFDFERGQNGCQKSDCKYLHRPIVDEPRFQERHNRGWNPPRNNFRQGPTHDIAFLGRSITEVLERFFNQKQGQEQNNNGLRPRGPHWPTQRW